MDKASLGLMVSFTLKSLCKFAKFELEGCENRNFLNFVAG